jgi:hypothetical protein
MFGCASMRPDMIHEIVAADIQNVCQPAEVSAIRRQPVDESEHLGLR